MLNNTQYYPTFNNKYVVVIIWFFFIVYAFFYPLFFGMKAHLKTPISVALALGIYFGIGLFIFGITARQFGYGKIFVSFMSTFYIGYKANLLGSFIGLLRWFVDAFVGWFIVTRLVGYFQRKMK